ncbi:MAG TPA: DUF2231 domain-containing protein [Gemmatimonadales bacterium]|nr:DUF2231 domain-containing protein [Gemmatimonadales bacterium]
MPNLAFYHPAIVHFAVALLSVGVFLRWVSLLGRFDWTRQAAAFLLLAGTAGAILAVQSGTNAHGPVERVPGARTAVQEHEDWGHRARNVFLVVGAFELLALGLGQKPARRWVYVGSALVGLAGGYCLFEAGEHGGDLVYNYAGGVGIRSGNAADVDRLLVAGLYQKALADRKAGDSAGAAVLIAELVARYPADTDIQLLGIESLLTDKKDAKGALAALQKLPPFPDSSRARSRRDMLAADVYVGAGRVDSARAILTRLAAQFPQSQRIKDKLAQLPAH